MAYDHRAIEPKWQRVWEQRQSFKSERHPGRPKFYVLDMFPYPSGSGLHVGHAEGYTASDVVARYKKMRGFDVLHPLGFAYDWSREIDTTDPGYVRWTQWIFLKLFEKNLAFQAEIPVNWCPAL